MGWKNSPPYFSAVTETIADLANDRLNDPTFQPEPHPLDDMAATVDTDTPRKPESLSSLTSL